MSTFRDLIVWQKGMDFVTQIYRVTALYPKSEAMGLVSQLRRAAVSIPSNIAEGFGRRFPNEHVHFLQYAMASLFEVQTQLEISKNLNLLPEKDFERLWEASREVERLLSSFSASVRARGR
jgi:four helix bundle protein